jgi:pimeloyl-ACP methyl ester carboxylesterase
MYYEMLGSGGTPLIMLHGGYMNFSLMGEIVPLLAETRQVIGPDLQAHGRTNDVEGRPLTYEQMADDVAAFMDAIGVEQADVFGYSMGGGVALQLVARHPERVRKLVVASMTLQREGWHEDLLAFYDMITPEMFAGPVEDAYKAVAPNPDNFPVLVEKLVTLDKGEQDWLDAFSKGIASPTLLIFGDSDAVRPQHIVDMFQLLGGGVNGDFTGLPNVQLAVLPGVTHTSVLLRVNILTPMITEFLDAPAAP